MPIRVRTVPLRSFDPYTPLHRTSLGKSVVEALLARPSEKIREVTPFLGCGVYALYYHGNFSLYDRLCRRNALLRRYNKSEIPIYVGKGLPKGARQGDVELDPNAEPSIWRRLVDHSKSIDAAQSTLKLSSFSCRYIVTEDVWVNLSERVMIAKFQPLWNILIDGFGNHDPGAGRRVQQISLWDLVHPGRKWSLKQEKRTRSQLNLRQLQSQIDLYVEGREKEL